MSRRQTTAQLSEQFLQDVWPSLQLLDQYIRTNVADFGPLDGSSAVVLDSTTETELAKNLTGSMELHNDLIPGR